MTHLATTTSYTHSSSPFLLLFQTPRYELYEDFEYHALSDFFHAFEIEDCVAGFNITDVGEAKRLFSRVQALRPERQAETKEATGAKAGRRGSAGKGGLFGKVSGKLGGIFGRKKKPAQRERMEIGHVMKVSCTEDVHTMHRRFEQRCPAPKTPLQPLSPAD